ncbi:hypothetical protein P3T76_002990 [Phytophthora citrophthora]|uniref:Transmembrane protein n=1 Tax=Phytophthora citrophthora TaxID=4793 RepID=A0AAD9GWH3_9STRA|nr:hypothetical protein P3T76_002990 [Phytophthora citrophthora]
MPRTAPIAGNEKAPGTLAKSSRQTSSISLWQKLEQTWNEIQVGRQGSYSVERLKSLDLYCKTTSRTRVLLVCICTPIPALLAALLLECLPLHPPSEGWAANWMFWVRFSAMVFILVFVGIAAFVQFVPNFGLTIGKRAIIAFGTMIGYVGTCLVIASTNIIGFPIPFIWQIGGLLVGMYTPLMFVLVFGLAPFVSTSSFRPHIRRYVILLVLYMSLGAVFPLYKLLYEHVPDNYKAGALIALPVWKFAAKHFMMFPSRQLEDYVPVIIALTVDFFSAMFVSVCISTSSSIYLSVMFIAVDLAQGMLEFREVSANATTVLNLLQTPSEGTPYSADLIANLVAVTQNPSEFDVISLKQTRLWACLPHPVSPEQTKDLKTLEILGMYAARGFLFKRRKNRQRQRSFRIGSVKINSIMPAVFSKKPSKASSKSFIKKGEAAKELVEQGLELLFHCEYLALVEYVECVIPLVFAVNKMALTQLPNAVYYPGGATKWGESALVNIFVFATLEIATLVLLDLLLHRKFAFSPLYQLAFSLETSMHFVQSALFLEIVGLLQYELAHLGR